MRNVFALQHIACEGMGILEEIFRTRAVPYRYIHLYQGEELPSMEDVAAGALVILGGPMNVYQEERYPFLKRENELIRHGLAAGTPMIGICLGAQLIAKAAGARVYSGKAKEIGWYGLHAEPAARSDPLFNRMGSEVRVFQWHGDTFDLPPKAVKLASSSLFSNQSFRLNDNAYALQFHLEVTKPMIREWLEEYREEVKTSKVDADKLYRNNEAEITNLNRLGGEVFTAFSKRFLEEK